MSTQLETDFVPDLLSAIGNTPIVALRKLNTNPLATVFVKLEYMNPSGSIKDRIARHIIETFEKRGILRPGGVIVENSSGNTAASVAMIAALKGYQAVIVVPSKCSEEKQQSIKAFGARLVVASATAAPDSPDHYENIAKRLEKEIPGAVRLDQYNNQLNTEAHYLTTGAEIWKQTKGNVDYFVAGASTGGTISGVGKYLKEASNDQTKIVLSDPNGSCYFNKIKNDSFTVNGKKTQIEGIGKNYSCECMHYEFVDDAYLVEDIDAISTARRMASEEGILCGLSSGANVWTALQLAAQVTEPTTIVTVLPDGGLKYLSKLYNPKWLGSCQFVSSEEESILEGNESVDEIIASFKNPR
jgi:cystathionine beta-synthase/cysteine synthase A